MPHHDHAKTTRYHVAQLYFEDSVVGLARQLSQCPGVLHVAVDRRTGLVAVDFDERDVTAKRLERTICDCGYEWEDADSHATEHEERPHHSR